MGILNKLFGAKAPISGGNSFETRVQLDTATAIALDNLEAQDIKNINNSFQVVKSFISQKVIPEYYLFQLQSYYFTNIPKFETSDNKILRIIKDVIKGAWLFGKAGIYKLGEKLIPIYITNSKVNDEGEVCYIKYCSLYTMIDLETNNLPEGVKFIEIGEAECKNVAIFKWGQAQLSAWLVIWPFVKYQNELLTMILISSYVYNKKWTYNIKRDTNINPKEIMTWFDPYNFLVVNRSDDTIHAKFKPIDMGTSNVITPNEFLEFYENVIRDYYEIIGRRHNNERKTSERNLNSEVTASQMEFNNYELEIITYFKMFNEECKKLGINFEVKEQFSNDNGNFNNADNNNQSRDNQGQLLKSNDNRSK